MNVFDHLKHLSTDDVKNYCDATKIQSGVAMMHVNGDFNFSTLVRNANFFGFNEAVYVGGSRKWDRRGAVGTHHYTDVNYLKSEVEFIDYCNSRSYTVIAIENNIPNYLNKTFDLFNDECFMISPGYKQKYSKIMFVFGEEQCGLSNFVLDNCERIITIPAYGSVRSLNVGTASGIVMSAYRKFIKL